MRHLLLLLTLPAAAQGGHPATSLSTALAPGLLLPVRLGHEVSAGHTRPGTLIRARLTQRVPVAPDSYLKSGTMVLGRVVASSAAGSGHPATLTVTFNGLDLNGRLIPFRTQALAAASFLAVEGTGTPCSGAVDRANPDAANWTTCQVGEDEVARSGWSGPVIDGVTHTVGFADYNGVYSNPARLGALPHALGVFSTTARGLYGYGTAARLTNEAGSVTITDPAKLTLHGEDNLLLQVIPTP